MSSVQLTQQAAALLKEVQRKVGLFDLSGFGPPVAEFEQGLVRAKLKVKGFDLVRRRAASAAG